MPHLTDPNYLDDLLSYPASPETMLSWMKKGLGRVLMHLERHDPKPYRDVIAQACTQCFSFNAQIDDFGISYTLEGIAKVEKWRNL